MKYPLFLVPQLALSSVTSHLDSCCHLKYPQQPPSCHSRSDRYQVCHTNPRVWPASPHYGHLNGLPWPTHQTAAIWALHDTDPMSLPSHMVPYISAQLSVPCTVPAVLVWPHSLHILPGTHIATLPAKTPPSSSRPGTNASVSLKLSRRPPLRINFSLINSLSRDHQLCPTWCCSRYREFSGE